MWSKIAYKYDAGSALIFFINGHKTSSFLLLIVKPDEVPFATYSLKKTKDAVHRTPLEALRKI